MMDSGERIADKPGGSLSSISPGSPAAGRALTLGRNCSKAPVLLPGLKFQRSLRRKLHALLRLPQPQRGVGTAVVCLAGDAVVLFVPAARLGEASSNSGIVSYGRYS
jgi:hypothetical protein